MQSSDQDIIMENQRLAKIKFKGLSPQYKDALVYVVQEILSNESETTIKKAFKQLEKGV